MNYSTRGATLTVYTDHEAGTVRVSRTNGTLAELTLAEADEATGLLHRALRLAATDEPAAAEPHPFTRA